MAPAIFLHVEYYLINRKDSFAIDLFNKFIVINGKSTTFDDVKRITIYMAPVWLHKGIFKVFRRWPFDNYQYAKIEMKTGHKFIFTCLMNDKVDEVMWQIRGVPSEKKARIIATTLSN